MKFLFLVFFICLFCQKAFSQDSPGLELEKVLDSEVERIIFGMPYEYQHVENKNNSVKLTKLESLKEIVEDYLQCAKNEVFVQKNDIGFYTLYAFSCNLSDNELFSAEVVFKENNGQLELQNYQSLTLTKQEVTEKVLRSMMLDTNLSVVNPTHNISPGMKALFNLAKVGVPVYLTFKTAKLIAPTRTDWQKHLIAGSIISGVTVLTAQALISTNNNQRLSKLTDNQINLIASFSGLIASFAAGVSKELRDKWTGKGTPDKMDALYTGLGGSMVSFTVAIPLNYKTKKKVIR